MIILINFFNLFSGSQRQARDYLTKTFYYFNKPIANEYLERAMQHLVKLVERLDGWVTHGVKYARVMALLNKPLKSVEDAFQRAISHCKENQYIIKAREQLGCYYLARNMDEIAESQFQLAIEIGKERPCRAWVAQYGLKFISSRNQRR